ncbi:unnamed protein product, partial [Chrysoparadoxa australica]
RKLFSRSQPEFHGVRLCLMRRAYVTLLYSDFVDGTRALGQSLRLSGTEADTIVLVTPDVKQSTRAKLDADGWDVQEVEVKPNPNARFQSRLVNVYTKLTIFSMVDYDSIVFLDSDTLVLSNIDELFECKPFCAVMRHSELLNSGVLAVTPDLNVYDDMMAKTPTFDSYTGGDQGFLNTYFGDFAGCPLFEPEQPQGSRAGEAAHKPASAPLGASRCWRLPSRYNGDWPLLFVDGDIQMVNSGAINDAPYAWQQRKKVKLVHFTFGTAKPWNWWTLPFLPYVDEWTAVYQRLSAADGVAALLVTSLFITAAVCAATLMGLRRRRLPSTLLKLVPPSAMELQSLAGNLINIGITTSCLVFGMVCGMVAGGLVSASSRTRPRLCWATATTVMCSVTALLQGCYLRTLATLAARNPFKSHTVDGMQSPMRTTLQHWVCQQLLLLLLVWRGYAQV